jgi:hypothetical protein
MRRTQLYLDPDMAKLLSAVSRERGSTVSELVRECIREKYGKKTTLDKAALARSLAGVLKGRKDLASIDREVRLVRKDTRRQRLKLA